MFKRKINLTFVLSLLFTFVLLFLALFISTLVGFEIKIPKQTVVSDEVKYALAPSPTPFMDDSIKFDVENAKVGDEVGGMKIIKLRGYKEEKATNDSAFVDFSGKVTITGEINYTKPGGFMSEAVCMGNLDKNSQAKMPKLSSQISVPIGFCFNQLELARKLLVKDLTQEGQGQATVTIDNYKIQWYPVEIYNLADLIAVVK